MLHGGDDAQRGSAILQLLGICECCGGQFARLDAPAAGTGRGAPVAEDASLFVKEGGAMWALAFRQAA